MRASQTTLGRLRYLMKDSLKFLPLYGPYFVFHRCFFVKRARRTDTATATGDASALTTVTALQRQLERVIELKTPLWLVLFPEGTRYTDAKAAASRDYARAHNLPEYQHVLTPRTRGFVMCAQTLQPHIDAIYDVCLVYRDSPNAHTRSPSANMLHFLGGACRRVDIHITRHPIASVPLASPDDAAQWLHDRFRQQDVFIDSVLTHCDAAPQEDKGVLQPIPASHTAVHALLWSSLTALLVVRYGLSGYAKFAAVATLAGYVSLFTPF